MKFDESKFPFAHGFSLNSTSAAAPQIVTSAPWIIPTNSIFESHESSTSASTSPESSNITSSLSGSQNETPSSPQTITPGHHYSGIQLQVDLRPANTEESVSAQKSDVDSSLKVPLNFHPMITRAKAAALLASTSSDDHTEPRSVVVALMNPKWKAAMAEEYEALFKNQTWSLVPYKGDMNLVGNKWVFKAKFNADGTLQRYKARLVAKGLLVWIILRLSLLLLNHQQ